MNIKTKLTAFITAFSIATSSTMLMSLPVNANSSETEFVKWNGHEKKDELFDTWDGTFDTAWLNEHTGDETDPYIIDSAEDWATLAYLTDDYDLSIVPDFDTLITLSNIDTSSSLNSNLVVNRTHPDFDYKTYKTFSIRDYMTQDQIDAIVNPTSNTKITIAGPQYTKIPLNRSNELYFKDINDNLVYTYLSGDVLVDSYYAVDYSTYITLDTTPQDNELHISYKIVNNQTGDEKSTSYDTTLSFSRTNNGLTVPCLIYDCIFSTSINTNSIDLCLYQYINTKSDTDLTAMNPNSIYAPRVSTSVSPDFDISQLSYYNVDGTYIGNLDNTFTYIGKGSTESKLLYTMFTTYPTLYPEKIAELNELKTNIDTTFANKIIKFNNNIDYSNGIKAFKTALAGTIDLNECVLIGPEGYTIENIDTTGCIKNGILVSSSSSLPIINTSNGLIADCDILRKNCFFNITPTASISVPNMIANATTINNVTFYNNVSEGSYLVGSADTLDNVEMLLINSSLISGVTTTCGLAYNANTISNCTISSDSEIIGSEEYSTSIQYYAFGYNTINIENCYTDDFSIYCNSGSYTIASQIQNIKNIECYTNLLGDLYNRGLWMDSSSTITVEDAIIDCKFEGKVSGLGQNSKLKNCTILLDIQQFREYIYLLGQGENCYIDILFHEDSFTANTFTMITSGIFTDSFIRIRPSDECDDYINVGSGTCLSGLEHCYIDLQNINLTGTMPLNWGSTINNSYFHLKTEHTGHYGLALSGKNTYFNIEFKGGNTPFIGCEYGSGPIFTLENSYIHVNYKGNFTPRTYAESVSNNIMKNCVYILTIDESSTGCISTGLNNFQTIDNSFVFVDEFPDDCYMTMCPLIPEYTYVGHYTNSTFIMPKLNWGSNKSFGMSPCNNPATGTDFHDVYAYVNVYPYQSNSNIPNSAIMISGGLNNLIYNVSMEMNFFDLAGNPADIPVRFCQNLATRSAGLNGVYFKTNVKDAAIFDADTPGYGAYLLGDNPDFVFKNISLDAHNGTMRTDIKSGLMAAFPSGDTSGPFTSRGSVSQNYYNYAGLATIGYHILNDLGYDVSNILIPEGQSVYYQRYLDDAARIDSENIPAHIQEFYFNTSLAPTPGNPGDWDYSVDPDWVTRVNSDQFTTAEIAYLLDRGATDTRTTNWTVLEDITFCAPDTGEILFTLPKHLDLTTTPYFETETPFSDISKIPTETTFSPTSTFALTESADFYNTSVINNVDSNSGKLEQYPIYKYTITNGTHGSVPGTAFNKASTNNGTIFAKAGVALLGDATTDTGYILTDAKANGVTIPSTDTTVYSVSGYNAPAIDTTISTTFANTAAIITSFEVPNPNDVSNPYIGTINQANGTITIKVPTDFDRTSVTPNVIWQGNSISPLDGLTVDFTNNVVYTVTAEAGNTKDYNVSIDYLSTIAEITSFELPNPNDNTNPYVGTIDQTNGTIVIEVPDSYNLTNVTPIIAWNGNSITPSDTDAQNFSNTVSYTVTAEAGNTKTYTIIVNVRQVTPPPSTRPTDTPVYTPSNTAIITKFVVDQYEAEIIQNGYDERGLIKLAVPEDFNLADVLPDITWRGERITPDENKRQNLTNTVIYTVEAESGRTKDYDIIVEYIKKPTIDDTAIITEFKVDDYTATIEQNDYDENGRITLVVSSTFNMTNVIPKIIWQGKTLTPNESTAQDLNTDIIYTVEAESGRTKSYDVVVCYITDEPIIADDIAIITKFNIGDYSTTITQNNINEIGVIEASIPENVDISNIIPEITWEGIKLEPNDNEPQDFTQDNIVYTVTAESGRNKIYEVHITRIPNSNPDTGIESPWNILRWSFIILLSSGVICFVNKRKKEF